MKVTISEYRVTNTQHTRHSAFSILRFAQDLLGLESRAKSRGIRHLAPLLLLGLLVGCATVGERPGGSGPSLIGMAEATGATRQEAVQAALQRLIQELLGVFIRSDVTVRDAQLVEHDVLTYSRGYVERYTLVKESPRPEGGVTVTVLGVLRQDALEERLKAAGALRVEGARAALNASLERERRITVKRLATLIMEDLILWHWRVTVESMAHDNLADGRVRIRFPVHVGGDAAAWRQALAPLLLTAETPRSLDRAGLTRIAVHHATLEKIERYGGTPTIQLHRWRSHPFDGFPIWLPAEAVHDMAQVIANARMLIELKDRDGRVIADGLWKLLMPDEDWRDDSLLLWRERIQDATLSVGGLTTPCRFPVSGTCTVEELGRIHRIEARLVTSVAPSETARHQPLAVRFK